ncbi:hypothetical protein HN928_06100, partial [bacterium]|nr:hypothetical protein [bacterium]
MNFLKSNNFFTLCAILFFGVFFFFFVNIFFTHKYNPEKYLNSNLIEIAKQKFIDKGYENIHFGLMPARYRTLIKAVNGYASSKIYLVVKDKKSFKALNLADDKGFYFFVIVLMNIFNLSLNKAIDVFFIFLFAGASISGMIGGMFLYKKWLLRMIYLSSL